MALTKIPDLKDLAKALDELPRATRLDIVQILVDLCGIADPSPVSDIAGAFLSLARGDLIGAAISGVSALPLGDIAKAGKLGKYAESLKSLVTFATRRPELAVTFKKAFRQIDRLLTDALRLTRKGGDGTAYVSRQLETMRQPIRKYIRRVTNIEKFGAVKMARKNGRLIRDPDGGPLMRGPITDLAIRNSRVSVNQVVDILENAVTGSSAKAVREGADNTLQRMALAESWEIRAFVHRSPGSEMQQHLNILIKGDKRNQIHVTLDAKGHLFRLSAKPGKEPVYLTPEMGSAFR
ncbi:MAG: hypothetical protein ABJZ55_06045 [Fuerstiella sp.]